MINEGGKWAHVVLWKCVFEPKAADISSLMHQPSTGHLRSTLCCATSSLPTERRRIDSPQTPSHSLTFFPFVFFSVSLFLLYVLPCFSCISFTPPLFHLITPFLPLFFHNNLSSSSFLTSFFNHRQPHWVCTHRTIASVFSASVFLPLFDLGSVLAPEWWPTLCPCNSNTEQSFNLCNSWHHRPVWYIS